MTAKVTINGEAFDFDRSQKPMAEMLALEAALKTTYGQWEADLEAGSARALAGFIWLVWKRAGREVEFSAIESGEVEVNLAEFDIEETGFLPEDPTTPPGTKGASPGTGRSTSRRSAS